MPAADDIAFGAFVVDTAFLGDAAAFALGDGTVRLVRSESGDRDVQVHSGAILCSASTHDGKALITGGDDGRVARVHAGGEVDVLADRNRKWIDQVAAGPNGAVAYASGRQAFVRLGDGRESELTLDRAVGGVAFAPKGVRLAIAGYGGVTLRWAGADADPVRLEWNGAHLSASFAPDGRFVVTTMQENAPHAWRIDDGREMHVSGYPAKTRSLAWTSKGRFLVTSGANAAVVWPFHSKDGPMGKEPAQLCERDVLVTRVASHPRKDTVAIGYRDGQVMQVDLSGENEAVLRNADDRPISALSFDRRGARLAFGTEDGSAGVVEAG